MAWMKAWDQHNQRPRSPAQRRFMTVKTKATRHTSRPRMAIEIPGPGSATIRTPRARSATPIPQRATRSRRPETSVADGIRFSRQPRPPLPPVHHIPPHRGGPQNAGSGGSWFRVHAVAELNWRAGLLVACVAGAALGAAACSDSDDARNCVRSGDSQVCAWRDGGVRLSTEGLEAGSAFGYLAYVDGPDPIGVRDLTVGEDGVVPGALGIMTGTDQEVTLRIVAAASDGSPLVGHIVID